MRWHLVSLLIVLLLYDIVIDALSQCIDIAISCTVSTWFCISATLSDGLGHWRVLTSSCIWTTRCDTTRNMFFNQTRGWVLGIKCSYVIIMVITVKKGLYTVPTEEHRILSHLLICIVFPVAVSIFSVEVIFIGWQERWNYFAVKEFIPVVVLKPHMILNFLRPIKTKSVNGFALD